MKKLTIALLLGLVTFAANAQTITNATFNVKGTNGVTYATYPAAQTNATAAQVKKDSSNVATLQAQIATLIKDVAALKAGTLSPDSTIQIDTAKKTFGVNQSKLKTITDAISGVEKKIPAVDVNKLQSYYEYIDKLKGYKLSVSGSALLPQ